jgi:glycosyltransferase involved in cell wall biosynthesis
LDQAATEVKRSAHCLRLLYVGRLLEWKGIDIALRAVRQLKRWQLDVRFTIVGDGPARSRLAKLAQKLELSEIVEWAGCIPQRAVGDHYRAADLFLFPSLRDSGGMAVLEALAHGLPVVCTELGGPA